MCECLKKNFAFFFSFSFLNGLAHTHTHIYVENVSWMNRYNAGKFLNMKKQWRRFGVKYDKALNVILNFTEKLSIRLFSDFINNKIFSPLFFFNKRTFHTQNWPKKQLCCSHVQCKNGIPLCVFCLTHAHNFAVLWRNLFGHLYQSEKAYSILRAENVMIKNEFVKDKRSKLFTISTQSDEGGMRG